MPEINNYPGLKLLRNRCDKEKSMTEQKRWEEAFERELTYNGKILTDTIFTERTEEVFVGGKMYHCVF